MDLFARPVDVLPLYAATALQLMADGFTIELAASYLGCDIELVADVLEMARLSLGADDVQHAVAVAMCRGLIV
jgi:hypothetical protein